MNDFTAYLITLQDKLSAISLGLEHLQRFANSIALQVVDSYNPDQLKAQMSEFNRQMSIVLLMVSREIEPPEFRVVGPQVSYDTTTCSKVKVYADDRPREER